MRPTRVEINLDNIAHNISEIQRKIGDKVNIMAVVKANGYGHGALQVARIAIEREARWLAVAMVEEALELREAGIQSPILVLGLSPPAQARELVRYRVAQAVCTRDLAQALSAEARLQGQAAKVHVKVDTGLGRLGILPEEVGNFVKDISHHKGIEIEGIFTHFSVAGEDRSFTELQTKKFKELVASLEEAGISIPVKHVANSAAVLHNPSSYFDLVRPGIMLYGLYPLPEVTHSIHLKPAMTFKTQVAYLKTVSAGSSLSYGRTFITRKRSTIATLPVGYADGYSRSLSNKGEVLIRGKRAPVVGRVCMDMILVDVSYIPDVKVGDEVVLFGRQDGGAQLSVDEIASKISTISYEVVCGIDRRVPRVYVRDDKNQGQDHRNSLRNG